MEIDRSPSRSKQRERSTSPSGSLNSRTRRYHPYFTPEEVAVLSAKQRGPNLSEGFEEKVRQQACTFIEAVGLRMGFPRKTIATAQTLYHRFRLFFPLKDFNLHDVSSATLYVSSKLHDTIKKPQDILLVGYGVRFPNLVNAVTGQADMDAETAAEDRRRLIAIERLILETICFNFTLKMAFPYLIKFSKEFGATKELTKLAWRLGADSHRTLTGLCHPPHAVALGCIYLAALLTSFESSPVAVEEGFANSASIAGVLSSAGPWQDKYQVKPEELRDICHSLLDLLITYSGLAHTYHTSPTSPSSPSPYPSPRTPNPFRSGTQGSVAASTSSQSIDSRQGAMLTTAHLTRLKIALREQDAMPPGLGPAAGVKKVQLETKTVLEKMGIDAVKEGAGKNEGTIRYLFGPDRE